MRQTNTSPREHLPALEKDEVNWRMSLASKQAGNITLLRSKLTQKEDTDNYFALHAFPTHHKLLLSPSNQELTFIWRKTAHK